MFTGIIKKTSEVQRVSRQKGSFFVVIKRPAGWKFEKGESISVNGVCSTVRAINKPPHLERGTLLSASRDICSKGARHSRCGGKNNFEVEYMPETLKKTTVGYFKIGTKVNLEKSLRIGDLLGGHFVQGHVDGVGKVAGVIKVKKSRLPKPGIGGQAKVLKVGVPAKFMKFIAEKGSIAVDGVSLTVVDVGNDWFSVSLVSYTLENTNLNDLKAGDKVNIETDVLAKYLYASLRGARLERRSNPGEPNK